jgi:soluble lytic murein transglycosylase
VGILSSMQKNLLLLSLLGASCASVAAVATGVTPVKVVKTVPAAVQAAVQPQVQPPEAAPPRPAYQAPSSAIASAIARWSSLRQSDGLPFSSYSSFLLSYRGWPGETALRRTAERAIDPDTALAGEVLSYFRTLPPLSNTGHAKHAFALLNSGRTDEARAAARTAWTGGTLSTADEARMLSLFGASFTTADHDARMEALLGSGDVAGARRNISFASGAMRAVYDARIALQTRAADAPSRVAALGEVEGNAGLIMDRANYLRASGNSLGSRQLLATPYRLTVRPANAEKWFETLLLNARAAANDGQWTTAYQIASQIDEAYPAGTDVSVRTYGERDEYTSLAWLAGTAAMNKLARPAEAARMFERYARAAKSPQTRAKGFYWAARAAAGAGQKAQSDAWLEQAAASPDQFYGQLSLERLGRRVVAPAASAQPSPAERSAFASRPLVQALRALGDMGRWSDQSLFVRALAEQVESPQEQALAGEIGRSLGRPDVGVWVAREARNKGLSFYTPLAFPEVQLPAAYQQNWSLAHGITRQESSFDRAAVSHAGARGLMQLMPGTAREQSGKLGMSYDFGRLTSDPSYNIMLGTSYFARLLDQWGGSVPLAVASYNAGAGNVRKWVRENGDPRGGTDMVRWIEEIPFSETRNYVQRVLENAVVYDAMRAQRGGGGGNANRLSFYLGKAGPG